jgi:hypothetical protein
MLYDYCSIKYRKNSATFFIFAFTSGAKIISLELSLIVDIPVSISSGAFGKERGYRNKIKVLQYFRQAGRYACPAGIKKRQSCS